MASREYTRLRLLAEIISSERTYINDMEAFHDCFVKPMAARAPQVIPEHADVFVKLETYTATVLMVARQLLREMEESDSKGEFSASVGDIFQTWSNWLKSYRDFITHQKIVSEVYERLMASHRKFKAWMAQMASKRDVVRTRGLAFDDFLIMPIQRVPRYELLLSNLLKNSDPDTPGFAGVKRAVEAIRKTAAHLNDSITRREAQEQMLAIQRSILITGPSAGQMGRSGRFGPAMAAASEVELVAPSRVFIAEGDVLLSVAGIALGSNDCDILSMREAKLEPRADVLQRFINDAHAATNGAIVYIPLHVFLFNDLLILTIPRGENSLQKLASMGALGPAAAVAAGLMNPNQGPSTWELFCKVPFSPATRVTVDMVPPRPGMPPVLDPAAAQELIISVPVLGDNGQVAWEPTFHAAFAPHIDNELWKRELAKSNEALTARGYTVAGALSALAAQQAAAAPPPPPPPPPPAAAAPAPAPAPPAAPASSDASGGSSSGGAAAAAAPSSAPASVTGDDKGSTTGAAPVDGAAAVSTSRPASPSVLGLQKTAAAASSGRATPEAPATAAGVVGAGSGARSPTRTGSPLLRRAMSSPIKDLLGSTLSGEGRGRSPPPPGSETQGARAKSPSAGNVPISHAGDAAPTAPASIAGPGVSGISRSLSPSLGRGGDAKQGAGGTNRSSSLPPLTKTDLDAIKAAGVRASVMAPFVDSSTLDSEVSALESLVRLNVSGTSTRNLLSASAVGDKDGPDSTASSRVQSYGGSSRSLIDSTNGDLSSIAGVSSRSLMDLGPRASAANLINKVASRLAPLHEHTPLEGERAKSSTGFAFVGDDEVMRASAAFRASSSGVEDASHYAHNVVMRGNLEKQKPGLLGGWDTRFFALRLSDYDEESDPLTTGRPVSSTRDAQGGGPNGLLPEVERGRALRGVLEYYRDPNHFYSNMPPQGSVPLSTITGVTWGGAVEKSFGFGFGSKEAERVKRVDVTTTGGRTYVLRAASDTDAKNWVKMIACVLQLRDRLEKEAELRRLRRLAAASQPAGAADTSADEASGPGTDGAAGTPARSTVASREGRGGSDAKSVGSRATGYHGGDDSKSVTSNRKSRRASITAGLGPAGAGRRGSTASHSHSVQEGGEGAVEGADGDAGSVKSGLEDSRGRSRRPSASVSVGGSGSAGASVSGRGGTGTVPGTPRHGGAAGAAGGVPDLVLDTGSDSGSRRPGTGPASGNASVADSRGRTKREGSISGAGEAPRNRSVSPSGASASSARSGYDPTRGTIETTSDSATSIIRRLREKETSSAGGSAYSGRSSVRSRRRQAQEEADDADSDGTGALRRERAQLAAESMYTRDEAGTGSGSGKKGSPMGSAGASESGSISTSHTGWARQAIESYGPKALALLREDKTVVSLVAAIAAVAKPDSVSAAEEGGEGGEAGAEGEAAAAAAAAASGAVAGGRSGPAGTPSHRLSVSMSSLSGTRISSSAVSEVSSVYVQTSAGLGASVPVSEQEDALFSSLAAVASALTTACALGRQPSVVVAMRDLSRVLRNAEVLVLQYARAGLALHAAAFLKRLTQALADLSNDGSVVAMGVTVPQVSVLMHAGLLAAYAVSGQLGPGMEQALFMLDAGAAAGEDESRVPLPAACFTSAARSLGLHLLARSGRLDVVRAVLSQIQKRPGDLGFLTPLHYDSLVLAASCSGDWRKAEAIVADLLMRGVLLLPRTLNTLIHCYRTGGYIAAAREVCAALIEGMCLTWDCCSQEWRNSAAGKTFASSVNAWDQAVDLFITSCVTAKAGGSSAAEAGGKGNRSSKRLADMPGLPTTTSGTLSRAKSAASTAFPDAGTITVRCKDIISALRDANNADAPEGTGRSVPATYQADTATFVAMTECHAALADVASAAALVRVLISSVEVQQVAGVPRDPAALEAEVNLPHALRALTGTDDAVDVALQALEIIPPAEAARVNLTRAVFVAQARAYANAAQPNAALATINDCVKAGAAKRVDDALLVELMRAHGKTGNFAAAEKIHKQIVSVYEPHAQLGAGAMRATKAHQVMLELYLQSGALDEADTLVTAMMHADAHLAESFKQGDYGLSPPTLALVRANSGASDLGNAFWVAALRTHGGGDTAGAARAGSRAMTLLSDKLARSVYTLTSACTVAPSSAFFNAVLGAKCLRGAQDTVVRLADQLTSCERLLVSAALSASQDVFGLTPEYGHYARLEELPIPYTCQRGQVGCAYILACVAANQLQIGEAALRVLCSGGFEAGDVRAALSIGGTWDPRVAVSNIFSSMHAVVAVDPRVWPSKSELAAAFTSIITALAVRGFVSSADRVCGDMEGCIPFLFAGPNGLIEVPVDNAGGVSRPNAGDGDPASGRLGAGGPMGLSPRGGDIGSPAQRAALAATVEGTYKSLMIMFGLQGKVDLARAAFENVRRVRAVARTAPTVAQTGITASAAPAATPSFSLANGQPQQKGGAAGWRSSKAFQSALSLIAEAGEGGTGGAGDRDSVVGPLPSLGAEGVASTVSLKAGAASTTPSVTEIAKFVYGLRAGALVAPIEAINLDLQDSEESALLELIVKAGVASEGALLKALGAVPASMVDDPFRSSLASGSASPRSPRPVSGVGAEAAFSAAFLAARGGGAASPGSPKMGGTPSRPTSLAGSSTTALRRSLTLRGDSFGEDPGKPLDDDAPSAQRRSARLMAKLRASSSSSASDVLNATPGAVGLLLGSVEEEALVSAASRAAESAASNRKSVRLGAVAAGAGDQVSELPRTYNGIIRQYKDAGVLEDALQVLVEMHRDRIKPDATTAVLLVQAYALAGLGARTLDVVTTVAQVLLHAGGTFADAEALLTNPHLVAAQMYALGCEGRPELVQLVWERYLRSHPLRAPDALLNQPLSRQQSDMLQMYCSALATGALFAGLVAPAEANAAVVHMTPAAAFTVLCKTLYRDVLGARASGVDAAAGRHLTAGLGPSDGGVGASAAGPQSSPEEALSLEVLSDRAAVAMFAPALTALALALRAADQGDLGRRLLADAVAGMVASRPAGQRSARGTGTGGASLAKAAWSWATHAAAAAATGTSPSTLASGTPNAAPGLDAESFTSLGLGLGMLNATEELRSMLGHLGVAALGNRMDIERKAAVAAVSGQALPADIAAPPASVSALNLVSHAWFSSLAMRGDVPAAAAAWRELQLQQATGAVVVQPSLDKLYSIAAADNIGGVPPAVVADALMPIELRGVPSPAARSASAAALEAPVPRSGATPADASSQTIGPVASASVPTHLAANLRLAFLCSAGRVRDALLEFLPGPALPSLDGKGGLVAHPADITQGVYAARFRPLPEALTALLLAIAADVQPSGASACALALPVTTLRGVVLSSFAAGGSGGESALVQGPEVFTLLLNRVLTAAAAWGTHPRDIDIAAIAETHGVLGNVSMACADVTDRPTPSVVAGLLRGLSRASKLSLMDLEAVRALMSNLSIPVTLDVARAVQAIGARTKLDVHTLFGTAHLLPQLRDGDGAGSPLRPDQVLAPGTAATSPGAPIPSLPVALVQARWCLLRRSETIGDAAMPVGPLPRRTLRTAVAIIKAHALGGAEASASGLSEAADAAKGLTLVGPLAGARAAPGAPAAATPAPPPLAPPVLEVLDIRKGNAGGAGKASPAKPTRRGSVERTAAKLVPQVATAPSGAATPKTPAGVRGGTAAAAVDLGRLTPLPPPASTPKLKPTPLPANEAPEFEVYDGMGTAEAAPPPPPPPAPATPTKPTSATEAYVAGARDAARTPATVIKARAGRSGVAAGTPSEMAIVAVDDATAAETPKPAKTAATPRSVTFYNAAKSAAGSNAGVVTGPSTVGTEPRTPVVDPRAERLEVPPSPQLRPGVPELSGEGIVIVPSVSELLHKNPWEMVLPVVKVAAPGAGAAAAGASPGGRRAPLSPGRGQQAAVTSSVELASSSGLQTFVAALIAPPPVLFLGQTGEGGAASDATGATLSGFTPVTAKAPSTVHLEEAVRGVHFEVARLETDLHTAVADILKTEAALNKTLSLQADHARLARAMRGQTPAAGGTPTAPGAAASTSGSKAPLPLERSDVMPDLTHGAVRARLAQTPAAPPSGRTSPVARALGGAVETPLSEVAAELSGPAQRVLISRRRAALEEALSVLRSEEAELVKALSAPGAAARSTLYGDFVDAVQKLSGAEAALASRVADDDRVTEAAEDAAAATRYALRASAGMRVAAAAGSAAGRGTPGPSATPSWIVSARKEGGEAPSSPSASGPASSSSSVLPSLAAVSALQDLSASSLSLVGRALRRSRASVLQQGEEQVAHLVATVACFERMSAALTRSNADARARLTSLETGFWAVFDAAEADATQEELLRLEIERIRVTAEQVSTGLRDEIAVWQDRVSSARAAFEAAFEEQFGALALGPGFNALDLARERGIAAAQVEGARALSAARAHADELLTLEEEAIATLLGPENQSSLLVEVKTRLGLESQLDELLSDAALHAGRRKELEARVTAEEATLARVQADLVKLRAEAADATGLTQAVAATLPHRTVLQDALSGVIPDGIPVPGLLPPPVLAGPGTEPPPPFDAAAAGNCERLFNDFWTLAEQLHLEPVDALAVWEGVWDGCLPASSATDLAFAQAFGGRAGEGGSTAPPSPASPARNISIHTAAAVLAEQGGAPSSPGAVSGGAGAGVGIVRERDGRGAYTRAVGTLEHLVTWYEAELARLQAPAAWTFAAAAGGAGGAKSSGGGLTSPAGASLSARLAALLDEPLAPQERAAAPASLSFTSPSSSRGAALRQAFFAEAPAAPAPAPSARSVRFADEAAPLPQPVSEADTAAEAQAAFAALAAEAPHAVASAAAARLRSPPAVVPEAARTRAGAAAAAAGLRAALQGNSPARISAPPQPLAAIEAPPPPPVAAMPPTPAALPPPPPPAPAPAALPPPSPSLASPRPSRQTSTKVMSLLDRLDSALTKAGSGGLSGAGGSSVIGSSAAPGGAAGGAGSPPPAAGSWSRAFLSEAGLL